MAASFNGHLELLKWFVTVSSVDILSKKSASGRTLIMLACNQGHLRVAQWLFEMGADIRTKDISESTAMLFACEEGHCQVAQWLFEMGADTDIRAPDHDGCTPLFVACQDGHLKTAQWLVKAGADEDIRTLANNGVPPMWIILQNTHAKPKKMELLFWMVLQGACCYDGTSHFDPELFFTHGPREKVVESLRVLLAGVLMTQEAFVRLIIPASHRSTARDSKRRKRLATTASASTQQDVCHLGLLPDALLPLIADFVGMERGRRLRNAREAAMAFAERAEGREKVKARKQARLRRQKKQHASL
jgi:hypothetical protein